MQTDSPTVPVPKAAEEAFSTEVLSSGLDLAVDTIYRWLQDFYALIPNIAVGALLVGAFWLLASTAGKGIRHYFNRKDRADLGGILSGFTYWAIIALGMLMALTIVVPSMQAADLLASLGIGSLAVGFAFKDILQNWLAGLLILLRAPFRRGDQISVNDVEGTVQRVDPRATIIRTYDGRDIVIPNTAIYTNIVTVHTAHLTRRVEIGITIGYSYEVRRISAIILQALKEVDEILSDPEPQVLCWDLGATSLGLKIRWWINSQRAEEVSSRARGLQAIKEAFDVNGIDLTDPQLVIYRAENGEAPHAGEEEVRGPERARRTMEEKLGMAANITAAPPPPAVRIDSDDPEAQVPEITEDEEEGDLFKGRAQSL